MLAGVLKADPLACLVVMHTIVLPTWFALPGTTFSVMIGLVDCVVSRGTAGFSFVIYIVFEAVHLSALSLLIPSRLSLDWIVAQQKRLSQCITVVGGV